jgi:hypothetical protein
VRHLLGEERAGLGVVERAGEPLAVGVQLGSERAENAPGRPAARG